MSEGRNSDQDRLTSSHNPFYFFSLPQQDSPHQNCPTEGFQPNENSILPPSLRLPPINTSSKAVGSSSNPIPSIVAQASIEPTSRGQSIAAAPSPAPPHQSVFSPWCPTPTQSYPEVSASILASATIDGNYIAEKGVRKQRVEIHDEDTKAKLAKLCYDHLSIYPQMMKIKFYEMIDPLFFAVSGLWVNSRGYMERWEKKYTDKMREDVAKSGVARAEGEWEVVMGKWISGLADIKRKKESKRATLEGEKEAEKDELEAIRTNMMSTLNRKRQQESDSTEDEIELVEEENIIQQERGGKKRKAYVERRQVTSPKHVLADKMAKSLRDGQETLVESLQQLQDKTMDRWEGLIEKIVTGGGEIAGKGEGSEGRDSSMVYEVESLRSRVELMEKEVKKTNEKLDRQDDKLDQVLSLLLRQ